MKRYYDPEYDRIVDETEVIRQYEWFKNHCGWFKETFEEFAKDNFIPEEDYIR